MVHSCFFRALPPYIATVLKITSIHLFLVGYPIYGPFGYSNASNANSAIKRIVPGNKNF